MRIELDITRVMVDRIEAHLNQRALEIDGHVERATVADQGLSLILCAARKAIRAERLEKSKNSKKHNASC